LDIKIDIDCHGGGKGFKAQVSCQGVSIMLIFFEILFVDQKVKYECHAQEKVSPGIASIFTGGENHVKF